ncbi:hypothetical protein DV738_g3179, partial [Chaetothyriales sp. CBS 135597]
MNTNVQVYNGEPHLTFWVGKPTGPYGKGHNYLLNSSYHIVATVKAGNGLEADFHEFNVISSSNTALLDAWYPREVDFSDLGGNETGWVLEGAFQEIDIQTGEVIFDWRASDHIKLSKTYQPINLEDGYGYAAQYSEFSADGTPICDVHFGPSQFFNAVQIDSYRIFKEHWVGKPTTDPAVAVEDDIFTHSKWIYMSWMGATEVRHWQIEATSSKHQEGAEDNVVRIVTIPKDGFETAVDLGGHGVVAVAPRPDSQQQSPTISKRTAHKNLHKRVATGKQQQSVQLLRAVALDANHTVLGTSAWVAAGEDIVLDTSISASASSSTNVSLTVLKQSLPLTFAAVMIILIGCLPCFWFLVVWIRQRYSLHTDDLRSDKTPLMVYQPVPEMEKAVA